VLSFNNGDAFTTGRAGFADGNPEMPEPTGKIYVRVEPHGFGGPVLAQLDTGAAWSILNTEIAEELQLLEGEGEPIEISTRRGPVHGRLENVTITIVADDGQSLEVNARVVVSAEWPMPTFLGYAGLLERIRFAIDPQENHIHFGGYDP
jgi:predicted aspartyl protease